MEARKHTSPKTAGCDGGGGIFEYVNYRLYLRDVFARSRQERSPVLRQSTVQARMGITSAGFLSNVVAGRKNLTAQQAEKLAGLLMLKKNEAAYFCAMVSFTQARSLEERTLWFDRLVILQKCGMKVIDRTKMSMFAKPHAVFMRELLNFTRFNTADDPRLLGALFDPPLSAHEVSEALEYLKKLDLVAVDAQGYYRQVDGSLSTGDEVSSLHLANFQLATMDLARRALQKVPREQRDISVMTMTVSADTFRLVKAELQGLRKRIAAAISSEDAPDQVYQLNMQLFPVTRQVRGDRHV